MKNTRIAGIAAVLAGAACLLGACDPGLKEDPAAPEDGGRIIIRAQIGNGTRTVSETVAPGTKWVLCYPSTETVNLSGGPASGWGLKPVWVTFSEEGYGVLTDGDGNPVDLTWSGLTWFQTGYPFVLDNYVGDGSGQDKQHLAFGQNWLRNPANYRDEGGAIIKFTSEEVQKFAAAVEDPDKPNENDLIMGCTVLGEVDRAKTLYVDVRLKHLMARVCVELTAGEDLSGKKVKVWLDHMAKECYALNRYCFGSFEKLALSIHPFKGDFSYEEVADDANFYKEELYLLGSPDAGEAPERVETDPPGVYRTHRLILPPQYTHRDWGAEDSYTEQDIRPRLHVEVASAEGTVEASYSGVLPGTLLFEKETGEQERRYFDRFESGCDITLTASIRDDPPKIVFSGRVKEWEDLGVSGLETKQAGIRDAEEFKAAVEAFNAYNENDPEQKKYCAWNLKHYGHWNVGVFVFDFWSNISEPYPEGVQVRGESEDRLCFEVDLHNHKVFNYDGLSGNTDAQNNLKDKMLNRDGRGVDDEDALYRMMTDYKKYFVWMAQNNQYLNKDESEMPEEYKQTRGKHRMILEQYGNWDTSAKTWKLNVVVTQDIGAENGSPNAEKMKVAEFDSNSGYKNQAKSFLNFQVGEHKIFGKSTDSDIKNILFQ